MLLTLNDCKITLEDLKSLLQEDLKIKYIKMLDENSLQNLDYDIEVLLIECIAGNITESNALKYISNLPPCLKYMIIGGCWNAHPFNPFCYKRDDNDMIEYPNENCIRMPFGCVMKYHFSRGSEDDNYMEIFRKYI